MSVQDFKGTINGNTITAGTGTVTISSGKTLTVEDNSLVNQDLTTDASPTFATIKATNLTDGYIPKHTSDAVGLANSTIYTDGTNVGIGTTGPVSKLDVNGVARFTSAATVNPASGTGLEVYYSASGETSAPAAFIRPYDRTNSLYKPLILDAASTTIKVSGVDAVTVTTSGNVGIGTTLPLSKLSINGGLHVGGDSDAGDNNILADGSFTSGTPNGGTAAPWKLGSLVTGQVGLVVLSTQYLQVDVNGTLIKLATI